MGWGVSVEVSGLTIADDPAFSEKPFLAANDVSVDVEFFPLLRGEAKVIRLELIKPDIRIVMNADGDLNVSTIGSSPEDARRKAAHAQNRHAHKRSSLADLSIKALSIEDGRIYFNDLGEKATPIHVRHLDFDVTNFNAASAFDVETKFAFPGDEQNVEASGKLGPLLNQGVLDASGIPVDLNLKLDSILLDSIRPLADIGSHIPPGLSIPDAVSVSGTARGSVGKLAIALSTDLTGARVAYATIFNKPAGTAMTVNANGTWGDQLDIASVEPEAVRSRVDGEQICRRRRATAECANRFEQLQPRQSKPDDNCGGRVRPRGHERSSRHREAWRQRAGYRWIGDAETSCAEAGAVVAERSQRSEWHDSFRQWRRNGRTDQLHLRICARESRRTSRIVKSAQCELCAEGRLGEARADIRQPSAERRDQRAGGQRHRGRRADFAANQRDDPIDGRLARKCFIQQSRSDGGIF